MKDSQTEGIVTLITVTFLMTVLYTATGLLSLKLSTGTTYATAIWIPSGIALGGVLVFGWRALIGIFIGSILINYHLSAAEYFSLSNIEPFMIGCLLALGAMTQAIVGRLLIHKWLGLHNHLNEPNDILLFTFLAGPVSCLINTSFSNLILLLTHTLTTQHFMQGWVTWYVGDSIGVLIFTPIFLILFAKPRSLWRSRIAPILAPLCISFLVVCLAYAAASTHVTFSNQLWFVLVSGFLFCALVNIILFIINGQKNLAHREYELHLEQMAHYDVLTALPNRHSFIEILKNAISEPNNNPTSLSVVFLGIDNFKNLNDTLGHSAGDIALQIISHVISDNLDDQDYLSRLGGDEFGILLLNKNEKDIDRLITTLLDETKNSIQISDTIFNLTVSIGIATQPHAGQSAEELIKNADIAMYHAKELGKNTFVHFSDELNKVMKRQRLIEVELRNAIIRNEFLLYYQPQVDILAQEIAGVEVLLRWNSPIFGFVPPAEFIPIAERNGLIHPIGNWVLQQLTIEYPAIEGALSNSIKVSVNVSALQLNDSRFYLSLVKALERSNISKILILEITETSFIINPRKTIDIMKQINQLGIQFSLDDFGMNYSSMRYLKSLPIAELKIDYYFIKDITTNENDAAIVNTIIQLSKGLKLPAVAEGVETREQLDLLQSMGCQYVQGFYFYKPMPLSDLLLIKKYL